MFYDRLTYHRQAGIAGAAGILLFISGCFTPPPPPPTPEESPAAKAAREMAMAANMLQNPFDPILAIYRRYAAQGNAEAQYQLGKAYQHGAGVPEDLRKAAEYFALAAAQKHPAAMYDSGLCLLLEGDPASTRRAVELWQQAAPSYPKAFWALAMFYSNRDIKEFSPEKAEKYFRDAIKHNVEGVQWDYAKFLYDSKRFSEAAPILAKLTKVPEAQYLYARCMINGYGAPANTAKGTELLLKHCSDFGDKIDNANLIFAMALENIWFNTDRDQGVEQMRIAANMGLAIAQYEYAREMQRRNEPDKALKYARLAAKQEHSHAAILCGQLLEKQQKFHEAYKYFTAALQYADTRKKAVEHLSYLLHYSQKQDQEALHWDAIGVDYESVFCQNELAKHLAGRKDDNSFARAAALFAHAAFAFENEFADSEYKKIINSQYERLRQLADAGNYDALFAVALSGYLEKGNEAMVAELLQRAAKKGHALSNYILGNLYYNHKDHAKQRPLAVNYFIQAARSGHRRSIFRATDLLWQLHGIKAPEKQLQELCDLAIKHGSYDTISAYAFLLERKGKTDEALKFYRIAADNGDCFAMIRLFFILQSQNSGEAQKYLSQAIKMDYPAALLLLGDACQTVGDHRMAFASYLRAIIAGDKNKAYAKVAECILNGTGCTPSGENFRKTVERAEKANSAAICYVLGKVYREGKIFAADPAKSRKYFELGAKRGDPQCQQELKKLRK